MNRTLEREVLRINERYLKEVVEAWGFCPWASSVQDGKGLERRVFFGNDAEALTRVAAACVETLAADDAVSIGLLIFPEFTTDRLSFRRFVSSLESEHATHHERGAVPLAMAGFHPEAQADTSAPERLVPFVRRSPDPTIQLVRRSVMEDVRATRNEGSVFADSLEAFLPLMGTAPKPSVSEGIAKANLRTLQRRGVAALEEILRDIQSDRARAYASAASKR